MFVVLFEAQPHPELFDEYLGVAKLLRPELEAIDGFIDNARFASARTSGRLLSLSTWRDEKALIRWRTQATHHDRGQQRGHLRSSPTTASASPRSPTTPTPPPASRSIRTGTTRPRSAPRRRPRSSSPSTPTTPTPYQAWTASVGWQTSSATTASWSRTPPCCSPPGPA